MIKANPVIAELPTYPAEALYAKRAQLRERGLEVFDFSVGDPIEPTDSRIIEAFKRSVPQTSQYPSAAGLPQLRQAIAGWLKRRFDVELAADRAIIPTSGSKEAIFHLPLVFLDPRSPRRRVIFGVPAYPVYDRGTRFAGGIPTPVELLPEDEYHLKPWDLPAELISETAIIWVNYPHNPTGAVTDLPYLKRLAEFAAAHEILLCCDECYTDFYFEAPPPSILQVAHEGVLAFHSLSKRSGMTGYRQGFVAGDESLINTFRGARANFGVAPNTMAQEAAVVAWTDDSHLKERLAIFRAKRDLFVDFFEKAEITYRACEATLYLWVTVPAESSVEVYAEFLADLGILVSPAFHFGVDQPYIRLSLVPNIEQCRRAIDLWQNALE
jgi:LL-diaminopimelate aminotransferase